MAFSNAWSDVIRTNWATCQLFIDLRTGGYQDLSSNARVVTLTNAGVGRPPMWETRTIGKGYDLGGVVGNSGSLSVPSAAELNLQPSGTVVALLRSEQYFYQYARLAYKRDIGVSCAYDIYDSAVVGSSTCTLNAYDGVTSHVVGSFPWPTARSISVSFTTGAPPYGYINGSRMSPPAGLWNSSAGATVVALPGAVGAAVPGVGYIGWLLFNTRLSGAEISQLHNDFMESAHYL